MTKVIVWVVFASCTFNSMLIDGFWTQCWCHFLWNGSFILMLAQKHSIIVFVFVLFFCLVVFVLHSFLCLHLILSIDKASLHLMILVMHLDPSIYNICAQLRHSFIKAIKLLLFVFDRISVRHVHKIPSTWHCDHFTMID